jgi:tetratricopeptide (TPR) repeat protein
MKLDLRGELTNTRLAEVLRNLKSQQYYGTFLISDGPREKCFFFARGGLRMAKSNCRLITVGSYLKAQGVLVGASAQSYDLELQQSGGKPLARHVICGLAQIDTATFDRHERSLMASEFMETVFWRNCCFEYRAGDPEQEAYQQNLNTSLLSMGIKDFVDELISSTTKARDLKRVVPDVDVIVQITEAGQLIAQNPPAGTALDVIAALARLEQTRIRALAQALNGWTEYDLIWKLNEWYISGWVDLIIPQVTEDEVLNRIRSLEEGLDQAISPIMRRQALAKTYKTNNDQQSAARHFKKAGQLLLGAHRHQDASRDLREAYELIPEDFEAHEGLVDALYASKSNDQARQEAEQLSRRYFDLGLSNRARLILEKAIQTGDRTLDVRNLLVRAYLKLGRSQKALELGREVCDDLRANGREQEALGLAERFVNAGVDQERVLIMTGEKLKRRQKKLMIIAIVALSILIIPLFTAIDARVKFKDHSKLVKTALRSGDYREARRLLTKFQNEHNWGFMDNAIVEFNKSIDQLRGIHLWFLKELDSWREKDADTGEYTMRLDWSIGYDVEEPERALSLLAKQQEIKENPRYEMTFGQIKDSLARYRKAASDLRDKFHDRHKYTDGKRLHQMAQLFYRKYRNNLGFHRTFNNLGIPFLIRTDPPGARIVGSKRKSFSTRRPITNKVQYFHPDDIEVTLKLKGYLNYRYSFNPKEAQFMSPVFKLKKLGGVK